MEEFWVAWLLEARVLQGPRVEGVGFEKVMG